ncbi:glycosyltransferase family 4 protein [Candidatus Woesearchaeota archaeon]|nr:glycosyltransferase family 4 protein [Candidatus Woesearchaeota archaeon]
MNLLFISKYPPIEGGVSAQTYWLAKALGEKGHNVYVVSNCWEVEPRYREHIEANEMHWLEPKNVELFSTSPEFRSSIPFSRYYESRIASIALDIIKKYNIDAVYSHYLLPYGVSALLVKKLTNKPWLLQHAGSDITRLFSFSQLKSVFIECFGSADRIIGYSNTMEKMVEHNLDTSKLAHAVRSINLNEFSPNAKPFDFSKYGIGEETTIFTYFGKISGLKKTYEFVNASSDIKNEDFKIVFVTEAGNSAEEFKEHAKKLSVLDKLIFVPFIPPWQVPGIMKASSCIVCPESEETPYLPKGTHGPQIAREAMAVGKPVIIGRGVKEKGMYKNTTEKQNILVVDPVNKEDFSDMLKFVMRNKEKAEEIGRNARKFSEQNEKFENYISSMEAIFNSLL